MTSRKLQEFALSFYRAPVVQRFLQTAPGRAIFETAYLGYKEFFEARGVAALKDYVGRGEWIIDIGANIGFFTEKFASWSIGGGKVIAIEPEPVNFDCLVRRLGRHGLSDRVIAKKGVAADRDGPVSLAINPVHPGDHRISQKGGIVVDGWRIDTVVRDLGSPKIGLMKIDVQGAEMMVLSGAAETIKRFRPVIFIELDDGALRALGSSALQVVSWLEDADYHFAQIAEAGLATVLSKQDLDKLLQSSSDSYFDLLALPKSAAGYQAAV